MNESSTFEKFEEISSCTLCGSPKLDPHFPPDVVRCASCRVLLRSPRPTQSEIARSYNQARTFTEWQTHEQERRAMWQRRLAIVLDLKQGGSLLDVGTGDAHFLDEAQKHFDVQGSDFSDSAAAFARKRGHTIAVGQIENLDFGDQAFDCITMWHILEHLPHPANAMKKICAMLKPGGCLVVAVPNEENRLARHRLGLLRASNPLGFMQFGGEIHLTHFQPRTFRNFLRSIGLELAAFGVDDIYAQHTFRNCAVLAMQRTFSRLTGWHFSMAMYAAARKPCASS